MTFIIIFKAYFNVSIELVRDYIKTCEERHLRLMKLQINPCRLYFTLLYPMTWVALLA